jgi:acyl dehydratase
MWAFEDIPFGHTVEIGSATVSAEEIVAFGREFDPQPFHVDAEAAAKSHFGGLVASAWHTASLFMRALVERVDRLADEIRAAGGVPGRLGPSPGFENMRLPRPVRPGDTLFFATTPQDGRPLASRPGWAVAHFDNTVTNQHGEVVMTFRSAVFVTRRAD